MMLYAARKEARRWAAHMQRFRKDEDGSVIVFTLFILVLMLVLGGMAVDFMRFEARRTKLQGVADAAVLAAADLDQERDPADVVRDYFAKAGMASYLKGDPVIEGNANNRSVTANAEMPLNTYFLKLIGMNTLTAGAASTAIEGVGNIEVSLVLDISGSMREVIPDTGGVTRIQRLREASTNFVNTLLKDEYEDKISISLVPYSEHVNPGSEIFGQFSTNQQHAFSHCIEFPAGEYQNVSLNLTLTYDQAQHYQFNQTYNSSGYIVPTVDQPICPQESFETIVPLTQNKSLLNGRISQFQPRAGTSIFLGMKWAVAMLDPSFKTVMAGLPTAMRDPAFADRPANHGTIANPSDTTKYVILMSDGQNDNSYRLKSQYYNTPSKRAHFAFESYQYYWQTDLDARVGFWNFLDPKYDPTNGDAYLDDICDAARAKNITVYSIAMGTDSDPAEDARGKAALENCASAPSFYYETSGAELVAIFEEIADQITDLRLTQ